MKLDSRAGSEKSNEKYLLTDSVKEINFLTL